MKQKIIGYKRDGYKQTIGDSISFADATAGGKETIYFEIIVEDKKESVIFVMASYADVMSLAISIMSKIDKQLFLAQKEEEIDEC